MLEIASQMILCLLLAALLGFIIGYLFGKMSCANDGCVQKKDTHTAQTVATTLTPKTTTVSVPTVPVILSEPRNGIKDNLTKIKGIGVKIDEMLNEAGIYHFDQIAAWTKENMAWANSTLGFPGRAEREDWVAQAKALAAGEETEFSKRVDEGKVSSSKNA